MTRRRKTALIVVIGFPMTCCFLPLGVLQYQIYSVGAGLPDELARARKNGIAVTPSDLALNISLEDNAAVLYRVVQSK